MVTRLSWLIALILSSALVLLNLSRGNTGEPTLNVLILLVFILGSARAVEGLSQTSSSRPEK
ncbi:hypothetical protein KOR42_33200 [Thalassoglobus neptunius]|uniref:Uncharacterized protein n=1 Tax=Thalassoglobus neptunius TaxID=1938619 RepID=A0A5C5WMK1_9PLAN|nr:hypothetical protein KOR42_33200 [Thalassoglobus neptunius]